MNLVALSETTPRRVCRCTRSYTLIELLAVLTIFAMAAIAVATTAAGGLRVYRRGKYYSGLQTDLLLGLERLESDIRGAFAFDTIGFEGTEKQIAFPAMVRRFNSFSQNFEVAPGKVIYLLDPVGGRFIRKDQIYSRATAPEGSSIGDERLLAAGVSDLSFSYCRYDEANQTYSWQQRWRVEDGIPTAVRVRLRASDPGGLADFKRTLLIRTSTLPWRPSVVAEEGETSL